MSKREKIVVRILLIVARMFATAPELEKDIKNLATHIELYVKDDTL